MRDFGEQVDRFGNISVEVEIGGGPGAVGKKRGMGASAKPSTVAGFLRDLADDIERAVSGAGSDLGRDRLD